MKYYIIDAFTDRPFGAVVAERCARKSNLPVVLLHTPFKILYALCHSISHENTITTSFSRGDRTHSVFTFLQAKIPV